MIYLTAIWLTPSGSSTHLHTDNTQNNTIDIKQYIEQHNSLFTKDLHRFESQTSQKYYVLLYVSVFLFVLSVIQYGPG